MLLHANGMVPIRMNECPNERMNECPFVYVHIVHNELDMWLLSKKDKRTNGHCVFFTANKAN